MTVSASGGPISDEPVEEHWEICPKCSNMDGGCPFCGKGYVRTTAGYAALIAFENKERRGRSPSDAAEVHFVATEATRLLAELASCRALLSKQEEALRRLTTMEAFTGVAVDLRFADTDTLRRELQAREAFALVALLEGTQE